ncbi:MAG: RIO1 family regulatory kinase/ATPase [Candidatus Jordarchaeales archaeon]
MKWLARSLRNLSAHDYKVLHALEKGMKTYEFVPVDLIARYSSLRKERASSILKRLHEFKLVTRQIADYVGYRLTVHGYDALALNVLADSGTIEFFGSKLGVGKESDVYEALTPSGRRVAVKAHRIGRTSFVHVKRARSYVKRGVTRSNWFPASCKSAEREYAALKILHSNGVAVPEPVYLNRHILVMGFIEGEELVSCRSLSEPYDVLELILENVKLAYQCGVIHGDLSEYNVIVSPESGVFLIDWPQYVPVKHVSSRYLLERDLHNVLSFFKRKFGIKLSLSEALNYVTES